MNSRSAIIKQACICFAFLAAYLLLTRPEIVVVSRLGYVAWYPAVGLGIAMLLGIGPWYAFLFGFADALAGFLNYRQTITSYSETLGAVGVGLCYGLAAYVLRGPLKIDSELRRRIDVMKYVCVTMSGAAGATIIGTLCLIGDRTISRTEFYVSGLLWFLGDMIAILGVAPFLLIHIFPRVRERFCLPCLHSQAQLSKTAKVHLEFSELVEAVGQAAALVVVVWIMFARTAGNFNFLYMGFIPIIWIAMRRGIRGAVIGVLALNSGIAVAMRFFPPTVALFGQTGVFMLIVSATGLLVGSGVSERDHMARELHQQTTYLKALIENSPFGIVVLNYLGHVEVVNPAFQRLLSCAERVPGYSDLDGVVPLASSLANSSDLIVEVLKGERLQKTVRHRGTDGTYLDLAIHAIPLTVDSAVRGGYIIYQDISEQVRASEAERNHSESLSKLLAELQLRAHERALLSEMNDLFDCCATTVDAAKVAAASVRKLIPHATSGSLYVFEASTGLAEAAARWGSRSASEAFLAFDSCWALRRGQPHWSEHSASSITCAHLADACTGPSLCVPLIARGQTTGILHLEFASTESPTQASTTESVRASLQLLASMVAGQIAMAYSSLNLLQKLQKQSIRDSLTDLFNRRFLEESLEREMLRSKHNSRPLSIILVDIDHFKGFNDRFGHNAGDHVLRSVADLLRTFFRACDVCCRYGGEEFAVILPDSSLQNAVVRANALRTELRRLNLSYDNRDLGSITISVGVAAFPDHGSSFEALLRVADRCLYDSKANGRDVVTAASPNRMSSSAIPSSAT